MPAIRNEAAALRGGSEALGATRFGSGGFFFAIAGRSGSFEGLQEAHRGTGDFVNGCVEGGFVGFGRFVKAGNLADELERSVADFVGSDGRIEVEKRFDVSAYGRHHREERFAAKQDCNRIVRAS